MDPPRHLQRQASTLLLQQRLFDIEIKLASLERITAVPKSPNANERQKSDSRKAPSPRSNDKSPSRRPSHRKQKEPPAIARDEPLPEVANGQKATLPEAPAPSRPAAPGTSTDTTTHLPGRTSSKLLRATSKVEENSASTRRGDGPSGSEQRTILALAEQEQRVLVLQAENAKLLARIAELTTLTSEQQKTISAAEERNGTLKKELDATTTSLANKVRSRFARCLSLGFPLKIHSIQCFSFALEIFVKTPQFFPAAALRVVLLRPISKMGVGQK